MFGYYTIFLLKWKCSFKQKCLQVLLERTESLWHAADYSRAVKQHSKMPFLQGLNRPLWLRRLTTLNVPHELVPHDLVRQFWVLVELSESLKLDIGEVVLPECAQAEVAETAAELGLGDGARPQLVKVLEELAHLQGRGVLLTGWLNVP